MKDLPQELLEEIVGYFGSSDKQSLRSCSLVTKSWTAPSQRHLFKSINLPYVIWCPLSKDPPPKRVELFLHVCSASFDGGRIGRIKTDVFSEILDHAPHHGPLFPQLKRLTLSCLDSPSLSLTGIALAPQNSLEHLTLADCHISISELAKLINHFANLIYLKLDCLRRTEKDDEPVPLLSNRVLKLSFKENSPAHGDPSLPEQLLGLNPRFEEVAIGVHAFFAPSFMQRIIDGIQATVKCLRVKAVLGHLRDPLTPANCHELRELGIYSLGTEEPELISTITSTRVQKIVFIQHRNHRRYNPASVHRDYWARLDNSLCQLIDRLEYGFRLEVEFLCRTREWKVEPHLGECLPMFHKKGRVRVVDKMLWTVAYCSDWAR